MLDAASVRKVPKIQRVEDELYEPANCGWIPCFDKAFLINILTCHSPSHDHVLCCRLAQVGQGWQRLIARWGR